MFLFVFKTFSSCRTKKNEKDFDDHCLVFSGQRFPLFTAVLLDGYYLFDALGSMTKSIFFFFFFFVFVFGYCYFVIFFFGLENCQQLQKKRNKKEF
jgi:hypothetical protein